MQKSLSFVLLCFSAACGGPASMDAGTDDASARRDAVGTDVATSTDASDTGATPTDAVTPDDATANDSGPLDAGTTDATADAATDVARHGGYVLTRQYVTGLVQVSAQFADSPFGSGCTMRMSGVCQIARCPASGPGATVVGAGDITLAQSGGASLTLHPLANGGYIPATQSSPPWPAGATVSVSAAGDTVPAFSTSLVYPDHVALTRPVVDFTYQIAIHRTTDLPVAWTPTTHGETLVRLQQQLTSGTLIIECYFPGASGSGTVPADALMELTADPSGRSTGVEFNGVGRAHTMAGVYTVDAASEMADLQVTAAVQ